MHAGRSNDEDEIDMRTYRDIIALGSRFFETKNIIDVLPWLNLFLKRVSAALLKDTPEMKYKRLVLAKISM